MPGHRTTASIVQCAMHSDRVCSLVVRRVEIDLAQDVIVLQYMALCRMLCPEAGPTTTLTCVFSRKL
jgi:hypothetical protein